MTAPVHTPLPLLQAGPALQLRQEQVEVPELGGSVIVRGLLAAEAFAVTAIRHQATRRAADIARQRAKAYPGQPASAEDVPDLRFEEWLQYGSYVSQMLARAVQGANGISLYTAEQWEAVGQHHPGAIARLQAVAERLSGLNAEDVEKNSPTSPA